jgi:hypothetical protein
MTPGGRARCAPGLRARPAWWGQLQLALRDRGDPVRHHHEEDVRPDTVDRAYRREV